MKEQWKGFKGGNWCNRIDVKDFIQNNYIAYDGDKSFLESTTPKTDKVWNKCSELLKEEKLLLCALMHIVPIVHFENDDIENIIKISRLFYYIDSINGFINQMALTL